MIYTKYRKVFFDRLMAGVLGVFLFPLILSISLLLFITQGNPIIFVQSRSGKNLQRFSLYKFRTLKPADRDDLSMENRKFTFLGKFLRRSGLDELPQLINIIKGEMSFVGPRPLPIEYEELYNKAQLDRFQVKPGITGWAQVHGRNNISWEKRFEFDLWYVNNISLSIDFKICWMTWMNTLKSIVKGYKSQVDMSVFKGSKV